MEIKKSPTKEHFEKNAKNFVIKVGGKTLHKKSECQYSHFLKEYYDFDTYEEAQKSGLNFNDCKSCFKSTVGTVVLSNSKKSESNECKKQQYDNTKKDYIYNHGTKFLHKKDCPYPGMKELCKSMTLYEVKNFSGNYKYCKFCHPEKTIPGALTDEDLMFKRANVEEKYNLYWIIRSFIIFILIFETLLLLPMVLTYEPGYDDESFYMGLGSAGFMFVIFVLPLLLYALSIKKKFGDYFTKEIKESYKEKKKTIYKVTVIIIIASIIIGVVLGFALTSDKRDNPYEDVWDKDPSSWTDDEKEYVNDIIHDTEERLEND